jgi:hypothetical protein
MIRAYGYIALTTGLALILAALLSSAVDGPSELTGRRQLVDGLGLTDLALCSEARYTRHPSQADLFSAFQDYPGSYEHFPTGSLLTPGLTGFSGRVRVLSRDGR